MDYPIKELIDKGMLEFESGRSIKSRPVVARIASIIGIKKQDRVSRLYVSDSKVRLYNACGEYRRTGKLDKLIKVLAELWK